ncbi:hypothetical protein Q9K02_13365 [Qipengyuania sp. G39]|uniref:Uncharacterized protein n=1 Tax=Qipengyuania profundimaris TaxID=3067652 RepID=A0ABT9HSK4_9SPHN|nr:hypothetical protein [Qipengyuania sp. G39]MDP4576126.1 hypothetical protein [Qipengyuania sp. G39]
MTIVAIGFYIVFFGLIGLVWQLGDRDDHKMMLIVTAAIVATSLTGFFGEYERRVLVRIIDTLLAVGVTYYAVKSSRYWPLWFAGILWAAVILGLLAFALPPAEANILFFASTAMSFPSLLVMAVGLVMDSRSNGRSQARPDVP